MSNFASLSTISITEVAEFKKSGGFDEAWYVSEYPDVRSTGIDPALHYLWIGKELGRQAKAISHEAHPISPADLFDGPVRFRLERNSPITNNEDWLIFVAYCGDGRLSECQKYQIETFAQAGYAVVLVINTDRLSDIVWNDCGAARVLIARQNIGYDFGAWRQAVEVIGGLLNARSVSFTNDSILPVQNGTKIIREMRKKIENTDTDVIFLTANNEVKPHSQSYFFTLKNKALSRCCLDIIRRKSLYNDKEHLILNEEIYFSDQFSDNNLKIINLFNLDVEENPTIHYWKRLLDLGFPFIKIQLLTAGIISIEDDDLKSRLGIEVHDVLRDHCRIRNQTALQPVFLPTLGPHASIPIHGLFDEYGAQQAVNPAADLFPLIHVPFEGVDATRSRLPKILAVIHGYYTDILPSIFDQISALELEIRVLVTTDSQEKFEICSKYIREFDLNGQVVVCQNRGRDVAPFVIEGAKHLQDAEIILHLHTKKSPHDSIYTGWGEFLRTNLIGSRDIALSILSMLDKAQTGLVYSDHFPPVNNLRNWGFDWDHAHQLLNRIGCHISAHTPLEFPTSTMFWARRDAIAPLFDLGLQYDDFEPENGQIDGTLAHAIERSLLYIVEHTGYSHARVTALEAGTDPLSSLMRLNADSVTYALDRPIPQLNGGLSLRSNFYNSVPEIYPVGIARSKVCRPRLNAILPTMKPEKIYGGITTALAVIRQIADEMGPECDLRVLITSDTVDQASLEALSSRLNRPFTMAGPRDDVEGNTLVGIAEAQHEPISLRATDMLVATAWWTADLGFRLLDEQQRMFKVNPLLTYIIQDFEPGFYNWSNKYALADATYRRPEDTIAILNSEELAVYMQARYRFHEQQYVGYELHPVLNTLITPTRPVQLILAYGRPTVDRNCFELLCEGLRVWQGRNPRVNSGFEIVFAGEEFDPALLAGLENARTVGKMAIEEYAGMLNRAGVGISLMVSPHPSYPPLEMASAGCMTVTNAYDGKDLTRRSDRFISLVAMTPSALADALDQAISNVDFSKPKPVHGVRNLAIDMPPVDYAKISSMMLSRTLLE